MPSTIDDNLWRGYREAVAKGEIVTAHCIASQGKAFYEEREDLRHAGIWRRAVASTLYYQGRYDEAVIEAERSAEMQPDPYERARSLVLLGGISAVWIKPHTAFIALGMAEEIARSFRNDDSLNAHIYALRAEAFSSIGDLDQGIASGEKCAGLLRRSGVFLKAAIVLNNTACWLAEERKLDAAERRLLEALHLIEKERSLVREASIYDSLGYVYMRIGHHDQAEHLLQRSATIFERIPNKTELAASLIHLSELHQRMRQYRPAREEAARALKLATDAKLDRLCTDANDLLLSLESDTHQYPRNINSALQRVRDLIDENLDQKLSLTQLARSANLSVFRLAHLFKTETGTSPASYVKAVRMGRAKALLETSRQSVKEIMFSVGLKDESHFSRDFKNRYGLSPTQHRRRFRAEENRQQNRQRPATSQDHEGSEPVAQRALPEDGPPEL